MHSVPICLTPAAKKKEKRKESPSVPLCIAATSTAADHWKLSPPHCSYSAQEPFSVRYSHQIRRIQGLPAPAFLTMNLHPKFCINEKK